MEGGGLLGLEFGTVVENEDPQEAGRVRIRIPGYFEEEPTDWAKPLGSPGGGSDGRGLFSIPEKGSEVAVFFVHGDPNSPAYLAGPWPIGDVPTPIRGTGKEAPKVRVLETDNFLLVFDDRSGGEELLIKHKGSNNTIRVTSAKIELSGAGTLVKLEAGKIELGSSPLIALSNGVVVADCPDPFTGVTHAALGGASVVVMAKKV